MGVTGMQQDSNALFTPLNIKSLQIKNRIIMAPMQFGLGFRSERARAYYIERAEGDIGAIVLPATAPDVFVSDEPWGRVGAMDSFLQSLSFLVREMQHAGTKVGIQLWYGAHFPAGRTGDQGDLIAPSPAGEARELKASEIQAMVEKFAVAAARVKEVGLDFINIHGAHGYLLHRFFSPLDNQRDDKYGGSVERRMTLALECARAVRQAIGEDYPLFWRLSAGEGVAGGITLKQSIKLSSALKEAGIDVIDVSFGRSFRHIIPSRKRPAGTYVPQAEVIKREVEIPVVAVGRINFPQLAEAVISEGKADLVAIGRQLVTDPHWARKAWEGRYDDIVYCDSCNRNCVSFIPEIEKPLVSPDSSLCRLNERAGKESVA